MGQEVNVTIGQTLVQPSTVSPVVEHVPGGDGVREAVEDVKPLYGREILEDRALKYIGRTMVGLEDIGDRNDDGREA